MAVPVQIAENYSYGDPEIVVDRPYFDYEVSPDGERFLRVKEVEAPTTELVVVLNWLEDLKRLVPTDH